MLKRIILFTALVALGARAHAAILPPEKLLPRDTVLVVTLPDTASAWSTFTQTPFAQLWQDPAMKPFRDKFISKFSSDFISPLNRTLGIHLSDYKGLLQGQTTFALLPAEDHASGKVFDKILLIDTKNRSAQVRSNLAAIRQIWTSADKPMLTRKIREVDFTTLIIPADDLSWSKLIAPSHAPAGGGEKSTNKVEITFGQVDSLLLVSDSVKAIDKVLSRQKGGSIPGLDEQPYFQKDFGARLRGAPFYAWANFKSIMDTVTKAQNAEGEDATGPSFRADSMLGSMGFNSVTSGAFTYRSAPEGLTAQLFLGAPEGQRRGLIKALVSETKDSNPPDFVRADTVKFWRWRIDIPHAWSQIESTLSEVNPQYAGLFNFIFQTAGKDKDEKYDLKSELLNNLGDDIIHCEKAPRGDTLADLNSPPSIYFIGSPNPDRLAAALKIGLSFIGTSKQREFLGRQIYTLTPGQPGGGGGAGHSFSFAGSGGYVALSSDAGMVEEFLRNGSSDKSSPLNQLPGLADAAQKVGGMRTGLFGFDNPNQSMRATLETLRQQPITLQDLLSAPSMMGTVNTADEAAKLREWADFSLMPPYDALSKYFYFSVYAGAFSPDGFTMNVFSPTPPKLR